jgi:phosphatidylethanolamine/phosphatidyl-N-methylethanolamine N-methyltransferase
MVDVFVATSKTRVVDINESMLAIAKRHNKSNAVIFQAGDASRLQFDDNAFDITCISFALHDMPWPIQQRVIQQMRRVTKPNGAVIIVDYDLPDNKLGRAFMYRLIALYESEYYRQFIASDLDTLLKKTGVQIVERRSVLCREVRILKGMKLNPVPNRQDCIPGHE